MIQHITYENPITTFFTDFDGGYNKYNHCKKIAFPSGGFYLFFYHKITESIYLISISEYVKIDVTSSLK